MGLYLIIESRIKLNVPTMAFRFSLGLFICYLIIIIFFIQLQSNFYSFVKKNFSKDYLTENLFESYITYDKTIVSLIYCRQP